MPLTALGLRVEHVPWDDAGAATLRAEQQAELRAGYGDDGVVHGMSGDGVVTTVVVHAGGEPVACGVLRDVSDEHGPGTGEVKRMYVRPDLRGRGLSRRVLGALEESAVAHGIRRLVLETGPLQPEAVGLYLTSGYMPIDNWGEYADAPDSRCFAKDLDALPPRRARLTQLGPRDVTVAEVGWGHVDAVALRRAMVEELNPVYPEYRREGPEAFAAVDDVEGRTAVTTFVVRHEGVPVACATHRVAPQWGDDVAELKRLYVAPHVRGRGLARLLARRVEESARALGARRVALYVGTRQTDAIAASMALGYRPVEPPDGSWQELRIALWFARAL